MMGPGVPPNSRNTLHISHMGPKVMMTVANQLLDFLVDTGATYSVINTWLSKLSSETIKVTSVSGETLKRPFFQHLKCQLGQTHLKHSLLYVPECSIPLLGCGLLTKTNAKFTFSPG